MGIFLQQERLKYSFLSTSYSISQRYSSLLNQEGINKPPLSALLLLVIHHVSLHMSKGPPKLQAAEHNPPYDVFSASLGCWASDLCRGDLYPALLLTKTHMAEITWFGSRLWVWMLGVNNISLYATQGEEIKINLVVLEPYPPVYLMYSIIGCVYVKCLHTFFDFVLCAKANAHKMKWHFFPQRK